MTERLALRNDHLEADVWTLGARLNQLRFEGADLLDGSASDEDALGPKRFNGAVVGPVANRIAEGTGVIEGRHHNFERNEAGTTTLHSGSYGVHAREWTIEAKDETFLALGLELTDGDGGFPGNRRISASYEVIGPTLRVSFEAETDAPTWINLALHPYWTLGTEGREGLELGVNADTYTPVDERKIPTGKIAEVAGTIFDLRTPGKPSHSIDHNFVLTDRQPAVTLLSARMKVEVKTDAPGVQIYSGKPTGIAIEPQYWPDAMHHPNFPSILLNPGETWRQVSTYRLSRR